MIKDIPENAGQSTDSPLSILLQRQVLEMNDDGTSVVSFCIPDTFLNLQGVLHGGAFATMLDTACGVAIRGQLDMSVYGGSSTLELKTSYLKSGEPGDYIAKGYVSVGPVNPSPLLTLIYLTRQASWSVAPVRHSN